MTSLIEHFREGGWGMFPTLLFGAVLLIVALRYARSPEKRLVPLLLGLGTLTMSAGALGFVSGLITTCACIAQVQAAETTTIALQGLGESLNNVAFALLFVVVAAIASSVGALKLARAAGDSGGMTRA
jgi:hypothetical protein